MNKPIIPPAERIAIGLPRGSDTTFQYEFIESLFRMFGKSPCNYQMITTAKVHHIARNTIIKNFLKSDSDYLLFIDSDMIWEPDSLEIAYSTLQHPQVDIVSGIYYTKGEPHLPVIKKLDLQAGCYNIYTEWGNEPFEVDGAGMGFMLIPRYVLEKMKQPMCHWDGGFSEDLNFCLQAKKDHGFKIWAHPGIKLGHVSKTTITSFDWVRQHKPSVKAYIREAMVKTKIFLKDEYPNWREDLGIHPLDFKNVNTQEHWDNIYTREGTEANWRTYPEKNEYVSKSILKELKSDATVLELGCGVGKFAGVLLKDHKDITYKGIDISQVAVNALNKSGIRAERRDVPPIEETGYDVVIGLELLEHLDDKPRLAVIKEVSDIIGKTGQAIFSVPDNCMPPEEIIEHRAMYNEDTLKKFLKGAFSEVSVESVASRPSHLVERKEQFLVAVCSNKKGGAKGGNSVQK